MREQDQQRPHLSRAQQNGGTLLAPFRLDSRKFNSTGRGFGRAVAEPTRVRRNRGGFSYDVAMKQLASTIDSRPSCGREVR